MFPKLVSKLYELAFKPEHAQVGFRATGIYPLDQSQVKSKFIDLSLPHLPSVVPPVAPQNTSVVPATQSAVVVPQTPALSAAKRPKRLEFQTPNFANQAFNEAGDRITNSILTHLQVSNPRKMKAVRVDRAHHGISLTEEDAYLALQEAEKKKLEKKKAKAQPKKAKSEFSVKIQTIRASSSSESLASLNLISEPVRSQIVIERKLCSKCKSSDKSSLGWRACEKCPAWLCSKCVPKRFKTNPSLEFYCSSKCSTN